MIEQIFGRGALLIVLSFYVGFVLTLIPMADFISHFRPDWTLLLIIYWAQVLPSRFGVLAALLAGIFMDVVMSETIGSYAFSFVVIQFLQFWLNKRLRVLTTIQQMIKVLIFSLVFMINLRIVQNFFGDPIPMHFSSGLVLLGNILVWPWLFLLLDGIRNRWRVYDAL